MKIGILGSGPVGQKLSFAFADTGNEVMLGSREPTSDKMKEWVSKTGKNVKTGTFSRNGFFR